MYEKNDLSKSVNDRADNNKVKVLLDKQNNKIIKLENQIAELNQLIEKQNIIIDEVSKEISNDNSNDVSNNDLTKSIIKIKNKVKILEDKAFYSDSLYFELINEIVRVEDSINSMNKNENISNSEDLNSEEYTSMYIDYLSMYQKGDLKNSLDGFIRLLNANSYHDLSDNCQYWIGEIYYSEKKYEISIQEFLKVFNFQGTNKADDSYYKLGLCYINLNDEVRALDSFNKLLEKFPNSEYIKRTREQINYIKKG